jgi:hypothetical protein
MGHLNAIPTSVHALRGFSCVSLATQSIHFLKAGGGRSFPRRCSNLGSQIFGALSRHKMPNVEKEQQAYGSLGRGGPPLALLLWEAEKFFWGSGQEGRGACSEKGPYTNTAYKGYR